MRPAILLLFALALSLAVVSVTAQPAGSGRDYLAEYRSCERFSAPAERLACFDAVLALYKLESSLSERTAADPAGEEARAADRGDAPPGWQAGPDAVTRQAAVSAPAPAPARTAHGRNVAEDDFTARIVRLWKPHPQAKYHFELDDGSIWRQTSGPWVRIAEDEAGPVEIFRGAMGGWRMRIAGKAGLSFVTPVE